MTDIDIWNNIKDIRKALPEYVKLVAAAKTRSLEEVKAAIGAGIEIIGENYIQEAEEIFPVIGNKVRWHFIGHLQKNKVKKAVQIFDVIETIDSFSLAKEIDKRCASLDKVMDVFIEVNSGREVQKFGILPEEALGLVKQVASLEHIKVKGVMTMGPYSGDPEDARPYFKETKKVFDQIKGASVEGIDLIYLSMGMTNSYKVAVEEGANMVRIGTKIFGERD